MTQMFQEVPSQFDFPKAEKEILAFWERAGIYEKSLEGSKGGKPFVFYEGPPTANGLPHPGHCLTRAIKDLFPRYKTMTGHHCLRKGGWDTHGLPVEVEVCKELGIHTKEEIEAYGVEAFNRKCLESVFRYTKEWEDLTRRIGFWVNLDEAYVTYHQSYVESVWWALKKLFDAGLLYQGHKIVWWWAQGGTALSAGEVGQGYREVSDPSVFVRFPLVEDERFAAFMGTLGTSIESKAAKSVGGTGVSPVRDSESPGGANASLGGTGVSPVASKGTGPELSIRRRYLPHWEAGGCTYLVTFRTRQGELSPAERTIVFDACRHFDGQRADVHALVVMPDHVHLLLTPLPKEKESDAWWSLAELMHSIKGFSAKEILKGRGASGSVWMEEYLDRIIRGDDDFSEKLRYITENPAKRGFDDGYNWVWVESDAPNADIRDGRDARTTQICDQGQALGPKTCDQDRVRGSQSPVSLLVWTTTPWTLPSNMFAAVHADIEYALVYDEVDGERLIFAKELVEPIAKKLKATERWKIERTLKGSELVGLRYRPPFPECYYDKPCTGGSRVPWSDAEVVVAAVQEETSIAAGKEVTSRAEYIPTSRDRVTMAWRVVPADFVTLDAGTGLVHEAPAFGEVDFALWQRLNNEVSRYIHMDEVQPGIPLFCAVAPNGTFTADLPKYAGRWVKDCDKDICRDMKERGVLVFQEQYRHDYPFCWRAEEDPLIQYPRRSWFIRTTQFKEDMLENNQQITWLPEHIKAGRFGKFLESNVDWSLSRERYWGTPLPIWVCQGEKCGHTEAIDSYDMLVAKPGVEGLEVWEKAKAENPDLVGDLKVHKPYIDAVTYACPKCDSGHMRRVPEVIDCWFDSGAMPFAQWGYPHRNAEMFKSQFPAHFISEALDQTRGWFYSLTAISVMLFGKHGVAGEVPTDYPQPFENCIVLGLLNGEDGLKMSKQKKNYKDPTYIFDREGADAMRWLFFSGQTPWTSIRFQESAIAEGQREFLIRLYNCYSFFVIYANIDKWTPDQQPAADVRTELDHWIISELNQRSCNVYDFMERFQNYWAAAELTRFVDALSNWYIRRCRDRFWKPGMDDDKKAAYATLYECLVTVSKLIAPFTPFIAESLYQNLVRTHRPDEPQSVHLCDYPVAESNRDDVEREIDHRLNAHVERVRQVVSCGRAARAAAGVRVRQPLAAMELYHTVKDGICRYEDIIKDELNIKHIHWVISDEISKYVDYELKLDFKKIGPKYGSLAPKIKAALSGQTDVTSLIKSLDKDGRCTLEVDGRSVELKDDEVSVELHAKEGWAAQRIPNYGILVLDAHITDDLRDEGIARDIVNQIQQARKKLDLRYEQRIDLAILGDEDIRRVVGGFGDTVMRETLAQAVLSQPIPDVESVKTTIEGHDVEIYVRPL